MVVKGFGSRFEGLNCWCPRFRDEGSVFGVPGKFQGNLQNSSATETTTTNDHPCIVGKLDEPSLLENPAIFAKS